ncbi:10741_t:CDS:2 [Funneliformis caledonium]|uniref:10741_t:CDS:1 n=1 Tax=Funneliformis caledonium TaxID=1117310 RepID=A0A9N9CCF0_9GLOM|nr:10741_t:CDS:2 [Funneliformis caledonium]
MTAKEVIEFERKLHELLERKPPGISASKIKDLTRIAMTSPKQYKNIVYSVQKFIQRCSVDYKLGALYVLDSISQAAARQKSLVAEKDDINSSGWSGAEYLERFEKVLEEMFSNIMQCPEYDKDKVKRVLDIWISKDAGIYSKEATTALEMRHVMCLINYSIDNIDSIERFCFQETLINLLSLINTLDPTTLNPSSLDSSALLATLNNLTQGTLNIPSFLSSQQINSVPIQPNSTIPYNSHATMPATSSSQFTNINLPPSSTSTSNHRPSMPTSTSMNNGYTRSPVSSYNQNVNLKGNKPMHDSFDFDYGDMDEADDIGLMPRVQNNDKNNAEKSLINNVLSVNAVQATTSAASTAPISQFNQDQFSLMANQLFTPSQNAPSISVTQSQIPPQQIQQPSAVPNTTNMPSIPPFQFPPPPQNWVAPGQPPQISSSGMPPLPEHYQPPPPFPLPLWSNQQNVLPPQQWNPNGPPQSNGSQFPPNQTSGQQQNPVPFQGNPPPPGFPAQPSVPISGQPLPAPPGHHVPPPGQPLLGHPMTPQGQPPIITHNVPGSQSGQQLPPPGHQLPPPGHHIPQPPGQTTPNQQQIHPNQPLQTPPQQPPQGGDVCVVYEDQSVGRDFIKVLSRTLYVGSVMEHMSKQYIEDIFAKHGPVSTVTLNYDKNHGFVKLETRAAAARALRGVRMKVRSLKVRFFGPKDCFEFPSGDSLIPLNRLTETDRKWLVTSKCGGTGESRKFSDASWEGSASPRRRSSYNSESNLPLRNSWSEKVQNAADQKYSPENPLQQPMYTFPLIQPSTNPPTSMDSNRQTPPQQPTDINTNISTNTQQQPQDNYNNNFNQRNEISSPPHSLSGKKRELEQYSADRDDEHYRENKKTRWD